MTGALHAAVDVAPGDLYRAEIDRLGVVRPRIVSTEAQITYLTDFRWSLHPEPGHSGCQEH
jgi:hypothetical protein